MTSSTRPYVIEEYSRTVCPECFVDGALRSDDADVWKDGMLVSHEGSVWLRRFGTRARLRSTRPSDANRSNQTIGRAGRRAFQKVGFHSAAVLAPRLRARLAAASGRFVEAVARQERGFIRKYRMEDGLNYEGKQFLHGLRRADSAGCHNVSDVPRQSDAT